jgi:hypothetical protein
MKSYFGVCAALLLVLTACSRDRKTATTANRASAGHDVASTPTPLVQPTREEARAALSRVFGDAVALADDSHSPALGIDLNGDDSQDLAVMVTVGKRAAEATNSELANWSVQDVRAAEVPPAGARVYTLSKNTAAPRLHAQEHVLAVVHGYGEAGWRDPQARQAYILVNAAGHQLQASRISELEMQGAKLPRVSASPTLAAREELEGRQVAIYWTGAQYAAARLPERIAGLRRP